MPILFYYIRTKENGDRKKLTEITDILVEKS